MEDMTPEQVKDSLREMALSLKLIDQLTLSTHDILAMETLCHMGAAKLSCDEQRTVRSLLHLLGVSYSVPRHQELDITIMDAYRKIDEAFEATLEAATQAFILDETCDCRKCRMRRQRREADQS